MNERKEECDGTLPTCLNSQEMVLPTVSDTLIENLEDDKEEEAIDGSMKIYDISYLQQQYFMDQYILIQDTLFAFALKLTQNPEDAKDLMQDTVTNAYAKLESFNEGTRFKSWISKIMRNLFINKYRRKSVQYKRNEYSEYTLKNNSTVQNMADSQITLEELHALLDELPDEHKMPFVLFFQGYKYEEIIELLRITMGELKSRLSYAKKKLKKKIYIRYGGRPG